jgi:CMP-N-acetylneuraminic acid synthetase
LLHQLESMLEAPKEAKQTDTIQYLHQIAEKMHRRSMIMLFTDMFQNEDHERLFNALQHLKHNKHKVVLFHVIDHKTEIQFDFDAAPKKFVDVETGESLHLFSENVKEVYEKNIRDYFKDIAMHCVQNKIKYVPVNVGANFEKIITTYLVEKQMFG